jgi:hypothetical protein
MGVSPGSAWVRVVAVGALAAVAGAAVGLAMLVGPAGAPRGTAPPIPSSPEPDAAANRPKAGEIHEGAMAPLQDWWFGSLFGLGGGHRDDRSYQPRRQRSTPGSRFGDDGREPPPARPARPPTTYRTVCVRLCDGYYFPISYSVPRERFAKDARACASRCGSEARLFVYRNPGSEPDDMEDLEGKPYRQLRAAFLYRTEYVPDCKCWPHPWEKEALDRHRGYALAAAAGKGSREVETELAALRDGMKNAGAGSEKSGRARRKAHRPDAAADEKAQARTSSSEASSTRNAGSLMQLGVSARPKPRSAPPPEPSSAPSGSEWRTRIFQNGY